MCNIIVWYCNNIGDKPTFPRLLTFFFHDIIAVNFRKKSNSLCLTCSVCRKSNLPVKMVRAEFSLRHQETERASGYSLKASFLIQLLYSEDHFTHSAFVLIYNEPVWPQESELWGNAAVWLVKVAVSDPHVNTSPHTNIMKTKDVNWNLLQISFFFFCGWIWDLKMKVRSCLYVWCLCR